MAKFKGQKGSKNAAQKRQEPKDGFRQHIRTFAQWLSTAASRCHSTCKGWKIQERKTMIEIGLMALLLLGLWYFMPSLIVAACRVGNGSLLCTLLYNEGM